MEEREEIQVVVRKEVLIRAFLYLLNKEGLINNKTYLATLEYLENEMKQRNTSIDIYSAFSEHREGAERSGADSR